jgi:hypothetical protein
MRAITILAVAVGCANESTSDVEQSALCPPVQCYSCEIGYYGPAEIPSGATSVRVDSDTPDVTGATVRSILGDPNSGSYQVLSVDSATALPHTFALASGADRVTIVTGWGPFSVAFNGCN